MIAKYQVVRQVGWAPYNEVFGRCRCCGAVSIRGICYRCGHAAQCAWCQKVHLPGGAWGAVVIPEDIYSRRKISHGICPHCKIVAYAEIQREKEERENAC